MSLSCSYAIVHSRFRPLASCALLHVSAWNFANKKHFKERLFRVAFVPKKRCRSYEEDKIDEARAMAAYGLTREQLQDLPHQARASFPNSRRYMLYSVSDVHERALQVYGSEQALNERRRMLIDMGSRLSDSERMRLRMRVEAESRATKGADKVVSVAFTLNVCDMITKFTAAYLTGETFLSVNLTIYKNYFSIFDLISCF
ncbi:hypothetical protein AB6A40_005137 [Gnathostoma spinigerum]|uniref:Uncharacterized protein n=1 Tax=Gnathostoma spinigerum TaxID=75299 RepID=A0ABD6EEL0_9BILA